jgi:hypothetical protein
MDPRRQKKSEEMGDDARRMFWTIIGAAIVSVAANAFQTHTQLQVMEEKLLGVERTQDLKIEALRTQDDNAFRRIGEVDRRIGGLEAMFYQHTTDNSRHIIKP